MFPSPTWRDAVDIVFLSLVTYQLYVWFRQSRALRVLIGLAVLGGIYSVAKAWGLFLTTRVFGILWQVLLILLLILFQAEIRQVLEKVSPLRYLRTRKREFGGRLAKELSQTAFDMAKDDTGMLIVIERDDSTSEFIHGGRSIAATPDPELIRSIFNPGAPAHDGAIVISQGRITWMGGILPLTENDQVPAHYGTRHRAALGLTERTDAVCVVVSEERSEVATVLGGRIQIWDSPKLLAVKLKAWLNLPEIAWPSADKIVRWIFLQNWGAKLGSLALVAMAWLILANQQPMRLDIDAAVRHENLPPELFIDEISAESVHLSLSGKRRSITALKARDIQVRVDLAGMVPGAHQIQLSGKNVDLPLGVTVDQVTPARIRLVLKRSPPRPPSPPSEPVPGS